jgi:hypothetical protein
MVGIIFTVQSSWLQEPENVNKNNYVGKHNNFIEIIIII